MCTFMRQDSERVVALIPARGGSKGIPRKNLAPLGGLPLIAHAIGNALAAERIGRVIVSTDSPEIAAEAIRHGAEVPFLRPPELARDETPMLDVILHAERHIRAGGERLAALALLQPTSPFLRRKSIDRAIESFLDGDAAVLKAVRRVREPPHWMMIRRGERLVPYVDGPVLRRQDLPELFIPCGALYIYRGSYLEGLQAAPGAVQPPAAWMELGWPEALDIDEPCDLELASWVIEKGLVESRTKA